MSRETLIILLHQLVRINEMDVVALIEILLLAKNVSATFASFLPHVFITFFLRPFLSAR